MYITRYILKTQIKLINKFFLKQSKMNKISQIYKASLKILKNKPIVNYNRKKILKNIYFIYNFVDKHWAETDGEKIWLNTYKDFNIETLYYTILHEALHGAIYENGKEISETKEHKIMKLINCNLI